MGKRILYKQRNDGRKMNANILQQITANPKKIRNTDPRITKKNHLGCPAHLLEPNVAAAARDHPAPRPVVHERVRGRDALAGNALPPEVGFKG